MTVPGATDLGARPPCKRLIVVVDDDAGIRDTLADLLDLEGYQITTAADGREALIKLRRTGADTPCLILLDLMMPVMTGPEFRVQQQNDPHLGSIPVCILSADAEGRSKANALGCEFLAKPVRIEQVLAVIARHCDPPLA